MKHVAVPVLLLAWAAACVTAHCDYNNWVLQIGMFNDYSGGYSDWNNLFGVEPGAQERYGSFDGMHLPINLPDIDTAWIFVADRGGNGGWHEETGQYEEYPRPGLRRDIFAPFGPGTERPEIMARVWAVEVHAPVTGCTWALRWDYNPWPGYEIPGPPFGVHILPNETLPEGLDLTAAGPGFHWIYGLPQWGPEPRIWLVEATVPEPGTLVLFAVGLGAISRTLLRRLR